MIYDAVIIGAGPAGACAGYWLAAAGLKIALADRRKFPREKLCGGLLTCNGQQLRSNFFQRHIPFADRSLTRCWLKLLKSEESIVIWVNHFKVLILSKEKSAYQVDIVLDIPY